MIKLNICCTGYCIQNPLDAHKWKFETFLKIKYFVYYYPLFGANNEINFSSDNL